MVYLWKKKEKYKRCRSLAVRNCSFYLISYATLDNSWQLLTVIQTRKGKVWMSTVRFVAVKIWQSFKFTFHFCALLWGKVNLKDRPNLEFRKPGWTYSLFNIFLFREYVNGFQIPSLPSSRDRGAPRIAPAGPRQTPKPRKWVCQPAKPAALSVSVESWVNEFLISLSFSLNIYARTNQ